MTLVNQHWQTASGEPITGRVPTQLRVDPPIPLTGHQQIGVFHAFKLFTDAVQGSAFPDGYHVQNRRLEDGTRIRMESNKGVMRVLVLPVGGEAERSDIFRGFVVSPIKVDGATVVQATDKNFLCYVYKTGVWGPFMAPYKPGEARNDLPYKVTEKAFTGEITTVAKVGSKTVRSVDTWKGTGIRGIHPISDDKYNDVFAFWNSRLYRNSVPFLSVGAAMTGVPCLFRVGSAPGPVSYSAVFVSDTYVKTAVLDATDVDLDMNTAEAIVETVYDFGAFFAPVAQGASFRGGPEIRGNYGDDDTAEYKVAFIGYNKTQAGAVQSWVAAMALLPSAPWKTILVEEMNQLGVPSALAANDGWTSSGLKATTTGSRFRTLSTFELQSGSVYAGIPPATSGMYTASSFSHYYQFAEARSAANSLMQYRMENKTYSDTGAIKFNESESATVQRSVVINTTYTTGSTSLYGVWNGPGPLVIGVVYAPPHTYRLWDVGGSYRLVNVGELASYALIGTENGEAISHSDVSYCYVVVPDIARKLVEIDISRGTEAHAGGINVFTMVHPENGYGPVNLLQSENDPLLIKDNGQNDSTSYRQDYYPSIKPVVYTHTLTGFTRDMIFCDRSNKVYVYIECEIHSNAVNEAARDGTSSLSVSVVVEVDGERTVKNVMTSSSSSVSRALSRQDFWGVNWGTSPISVQYHAPPRIDPIYAPLWLEQGACPFLSYSTKTENSRLNGRRINYHFRLQLVKTYRLPDEPSPPTLPNVTQYRPYLMEQMIGNYWLDLNELNNVFSALEASAVVVKGSFPDGLFSEIGSPTEDAEDFAKFYRT